MAYGHINEGCAPRRKRYEKFSQACDSVSDGNSDL